MIDDEVNDIIDMVGEEAIRIIVTHADVEADKAGFSVEDVKSSVSRLADVPRERIMVIGLDTSGAEIEEFVRSTLLSKPVEIKLDITEVVRLASGSKQSRRITKSIRDIYARIAAATVYCNEITQSGTNKNHENDIEIMDLQRATTEMVTKDRERVFKDAASLSIDEQTVCYAKAGAWLSLKLKNFVEASNTFLSWNVTDVSDPRNHYRACNHCGAVFVKVEGCDGATTCGAIPSTKSEDDKSKSGISFATLYSWIEDGKRWIVRGSRKERKRFLQCFDYTNSNNNATKPSTATLESGCGQSVAWSSMHPISPELVAALGKVEQVRPGKLQEHSSQKFEIEIQSQEEIHRQKLQRELK
ncbi:expressed unknown protein [Seminavis robusta]|uniref:Uncharacterized protein n=1 Tax=Seminavis robusta TaxID=568900 RepID=A0A9N8DEB5_9STRA|nr:expressed unknown protein [Seminavis robusta]|eukprot:Sro102_g052220.1 n/a (358) ;mRNA; f:107324-108397